MPIFNGWVMILVVSAEAAPPIGQGLELDFHNELSRTWVH